MRRFLLKSVSGMLLNSSDTGSAVAQITAGANQTLDGLHDRHTPYQKYLAKRLTRFR